MTLPLTKTLDPADFDQLTEELVIVDRHFTKDREQHPARRWEYAMALRASQEWRASRNGWSILRSYDIGGGGSPFRWMSAGPMPVVVDPAVDPGSGDPVRLDEFVRMRPQLADAVYCLSVLEHVEDLDQFLYHLSCLVAPGGLLFLTMDCRENGPHDSCWPVDDRHFHWMRKRIFTPDLILDCVETPLLYLGLWHQGVTDYTYRGHQVYDYSFASLALVKRP